MLPVACSVRRGAVTASSTIITAVPHRCLPAAASAQTPPLTHSPCCRQLASTATATTTATTSLLPPLPPGRAVTVPASNVQVLTTPTELHQTLVKLAGSATRRVSLCSLYVGTGALEQELMQAVARQAQRHQSLHVRMCFDHGRGLRDADANSLTAARPVLAVASGEARTCVSFFRMPQHRRWMGLPTLLPSRVREALGVQHAKVYVFDDTVVLTGANLSHDYFTNRQDRCVVLHDCGGVARQLHAFVDELSARGDHAVGGDTGLAATSLRPPLKPMHTLVRDLDAALTVHGAGSSCTGDGDVHTVTVAPLMQCKALGVMEDQAFTQRLLEAVGPNHDVVMATGYFNLPAAYSRRILATPCPRLRVLTASARANGFHGARGLAAAIPDAYADIARAFCAQARRAGRAGVVKVLQYDRPGWTYHAKGVWVADAAQQEDMMTVIGSPNFGERSVHRDLELQFVLRTRSRDLCAGLVAERDGLLAHSAPVDEWSGAPPPLWLRLAWRVLKPFL